MPSPPIPESEQEALLAQLEQVFALAQVITSDAEEAVRLVERAYSQALATPTEGRSEDPQVRLFRHMLRARESGTLSSDAEGEAPSELFNFRRRLATEFVDQTLPAAFAALSSEQRLLLMLSEVHGLDCRRISLVLETAEEAACARLEEARRSVREAVYASATEAERHLIESGLSSEWIRGALQRMADAELVTLPPTVRPSLLTSMRQSPDESDLPAANQPSIAGSGSNRRSAIGRLLIRFAAILLLVAVAGLLGYGFTNLMQRSPKANLIALSAREAVDVEPTFQTTSPEQAERYVYDRLSRRITVPSINEAGFQGVSIRAIVDDAEVPVLIYEDGSGGMIVVYVYSYAFLDRFEGSLVLERDVLSQIEEEGHFDLHDLGREKALVWRRRDDILVAITAGDAEELRQRIVYPA